MSLSPSGVLTGADRIILEVAACLLAEFRECPAAFQGQKYTHLRGALASMGMSPSDRQKLGTEKPKENSGFDEF